MLICCILKHLNSFVLVFVYLFKKKFKSNNSYLLKYIYLWNYCHYRTWAGIFMKWFFSVFILFKNWLSIIKVDDLIYYKNTWWLIDMWKVFCHTHKNVDKSYEIQILSSNFNNLKIILKIFNIEFLNLFVCQIRDGGS